MNILDGSFQEFAVPAGSRLVDILVDSSGVVWYAAAGTSKIGRYDPTGDKLSEFGVPSVSPPDNLTIDVSGDLWFIERGTNRLGKVVRASGAVLEYAVGSHSDVLNGLVANGTGAVLFSASGPTGTRIYRLEVAGGNITGEYPISLEPVDIPDLALAGNNDLWFVERSTGKLGHLTILQ